jgi:hypothetical protein
MSNRQKRSRRLSKSRKDGGRVPAVMAPVSSPEGSGRVLFRERTHAQHFPYSACAARIEAQPEPFDLAQPPGPSLRQWHRSEQSKSHARAESLYVTDDSRRGCDCSAWLAGPLRQPTPNCIVDDPAARPTQNAIAAEPAQSAGSVVLQLAPLERKRKKIKRKALPTRKSSRIGQIINALLNRRRKKDGMPCELAGSRHGTFRRPLYELSFDPGIRCRVGYRRTLTIVRRRWSGILRSASRRLPTHRSSAA